MSCVVMSEFSEQKKLGKGDFELKHAVSGTAEYLNGVLDKKKLSNRFKVIHPSSMEMHEFYLYRQLRNSQFHKVFGFSYDIAEDHTYSENSVKPDGGLLWLVDSKTHTRYPIMVAEMKYQGTNKGRKEAGLSKQASGNANERAGKYTALFGSLWEFDDILPLVVFHSGCDYHISKDGKPLNGSAQTQMAKLLSMNGFHPVNTIYTSKNMPKTRRHLPNTIMVKEDFWTIEEMRKVLDKVGLDSMQYFIKHIRKVEKVK